jgi:hypothetical protein
MSDRRHDLEQAIMHAWNTTDDLTLIGGRIKEHDGDDYTSKHVLLLSELLEIRMEKVMEAFRKLPHGQEERESFDDDLEESIQQEKVDFDLSNDKRPLDYPIGSDENREWDLP